MGVTVRDLLMRPFELRSINEKLEIILGGKPRPKKFKSEWYDKEQWLTACDVSGNFFCWSCLLFVTETNSVWNAYGFSDVNVLFPTFDEHKSTQAHISGVLGLQLFLNENFVEVPVRTEISAPVKKNRDIVKRIVDVVCHIAKIKTPISDGTKTCDQHIVEDCIEYLSVIKTYDLHNNSDEAINLIIACPKVLTDVINTLTKSVALEVKNEVQSSTYVSLILSEHSEIDLKYKLSSVLRYIKDGKVYERFIGFSPSIVYKSSTLMENHILGILAKYEIGKKLLAFSCDGSVLSMRHLKAIVTFLRTKFPGFQFVPCYYHDFDFVLEQSVSGIHECRLFFQNLRSIKSYLQGSSKIRKEFNSFMSHNIPNLCDLKLSDSHFVRVLKLHRQEFIKFFMGIEQNFDEYSEDDVARASGFATLLAELQTIFLIESFYVVFCHTAILSETLSSCYPENVFEKSVIEDIQTTLQSNREENFVRAWSVTVQELAGVAEKSARETDQSKRSYLHLYNKIMDQLVSEIDIRLNSLEKLNFFHILNSECQGKFTVYNDHVQNLVAMYGSCINETLLKNELHIINSNNSILLGNSIYQFLETLVAMNLQNIFRNVVNLAELVLSMPCKPLNSSDSTSKYDSIKAWSTVLGNGSILDDLSVLAIEKDILQNVKSQANFYDEFMSMFQKLNNTLQVT